VGFKMNFSGRRWLLTFVLDFFLKGGCLYLVGMASELGAAPVSIFFWLALGWSTFHFLSLFLGCSFVALFNLGQALKFWLALVVANILFTGCVVSLWIWSIKGGLETGCSGIEGKCDWVKGSITPDGVRTLAVIAVIVVVINLMPFLLGASLSRLANRIRLSLQQNRARASIGD
jgi:hypothetical protein